MLYERLNTKMRQTVDKFATRVAALSWERRSDLLAEASRPFAEQFQGPQARLAAKGFLTAVLERLDGTEQVVTDPIQASLFHLSLNPAHRRLADLYLDRNPEVRAVIERELGRPTREEPEVDDGLVN